MYPDRDTLRNVPRSEDITARDQRGKGRDRRREEHCQFSFS